MNIDSLYEKKRAKLKELDEAVKVEEKDFNEKLVDGLNEEITQIDKQIRSLQEANDVLLKSVESGDREFPEDKKTKEHMPLRDRLEKFLRGQHVMPDGTTQAVRSNDELPLIANDLTKDRNYNWETRAYDWNLTSATGGYLVPTQLTDFIGEAQAFVGGMMTPGLCTTWKVGTGQVTYIPVVNDTSEKGAVVAQSTAMTSGSGVTYSQQTLTYYKITSHIATIANELIQDSTFDIVAHVLDLQTKRLVRGLNYYFTLGTGTSMPYGIQAVSHKTVDADPRALTRDNLVELLYDTNRAYRGPGSAFMMDDSSVGYIRKLAKSATYLENQPVWQDSMQSGEPARLEGWPVVVNSDVDEINAYNMPVFFGDWKRFIIAECLPMKIIDASEYYKPSDQRGFAILGRWASNLSAISGDYPIQHIRNAST